MEPKAEETGTEGVKGAGSVEVAAEGAPDEKAVKEEEGKEVDAQMPDAEKVEDEENAEGNETSAPMEAGWSCQPPVTLACEKWQIG